MAGTVSKIVRFEDEERFIEDIDFALERFSYLASKYGHNPVRGVVLWDSIAIEDNEDVKVFRVGEFPFVEGMLKLDLEKIRTLEKYFDEMESKWDELTVEEINAYVELMNEALGEKRVFYDAYSLGLDRNTAYIIIDVHALHYLAGILEGEEKELLDEAAEVLLKYI
jgi:hypothetical protein